MKEMTARPLDQEQVGKGTPAALLLVDVASISLYLTACLLPTINDDLGYPGFVLLAIGWLGLFVGQFAWYANPLLWAAWVSLWKEHCGRAIVLGAIAFALGLHTFTLVEIPNFTTGIEVEGVGIGVYVWLGSMAVLVVGATILGLGQRCLSSRSIAQVIQLHRTRR